jgi:hypothetical protein
MCELSTLLRSLKIDGRPLAFEHAVLISECASEAPRDWALDILGVHAEDVDRLKSPHTFMASGGPGEGYSGTVRGAPEANTWHARLQGSGPLHRLREVSTHGDRTARAGQAS